MSLNDNALIDADLHQIKMSYDNKVKLFKDQKSNFMRVLFFFLTSVLPAQHLQSNYYSNVYTVNAKYLSATARLTQRTALY